MPCPGEPIAIIGTGCRFPGNSTTPSKLWDLLREPRDLLEPLDRFSPEGWYHENGKYHGHCNVKHSYQLAGEGSHRRFDAQFFGINAVEANTIDPQMRLLLETVYEALEAAGQPIESLRGSDTAVYTGMMNNSYKTVMERDLDSIGTYHVSGTSRAMMSNRLSYFFDWHGPSMTIDTACSSSMVAVHQAVQQLRSGQSHVAIAAGSNLLLDPTDYVGMSKLEMLSAESRSRMWDKDANGYARGEGVAAVILKTLSAAEADGDHIECLIRETATNQDGRTPGITMPSAAAQAQLIRDCYARAGLHPADPAGRPQYFEAHGTGTPAGDPIEAEAINMAFFPDGSIVQQHPDPMFVGGVKTVIGHSESVAGLAGLIKTSLALQNSTVPPNLLFHEINPKVEPFYANLRIPTSATPWPCVQDGFPRRASVNNFGFGGANAHAILESYTPDKQALDTGTSCFIPFVFSAASEASLSSNLTSLSQHLRENDASVDLRDLAMTLQSRRSRLLLGTAVAASTVEDLSRKLEAKCKGAVSDSEQPVGIRSSFKQSGDHLRKPKVLGIFTGQGAQSARMGAALIEQSESCRRIIDKLEARLSELPSADRPSWSLKQELLKDDTVRVGQATLSQPLCTALQILQVDLLRVAGVEFSAVVGHSSGEIGAAYCAGMISAEDAICIAYYRGLHSDLAGSSSGTRGAMLAVATSFEDAQELCSDEDFQSRVSVAAINSSASVTLSGDEDAVEQIKIIFEDEGKAVRRLKVDKAYHSSHMVPCSSAYLRALQELDIEPHDATTSWFSSVDGGQVMVFDDAARLKATYWNDNMVKPVMFMAAIKGAWDSQGPFDLAVEFGPHPALRGPALQTIQDLSLQEIPYTGLHTRGENAVASLADALGYLWTHLGTVDLSSYDRFLSGRTNFDLVTGLPPYVWEHEKEYWHESRYAKAVRTRPQLVHELLGHLTPDSTDQDLRWRNIICPKEIPWLKDHALQQQAVFPAAGYVVAAIEASAAMTKARGLAVSLIEVLDLDIGKALAFDSADTRMEMITSLTDVQQRGTKIDAVFKANATPTYQGTVLTLLASGRIRVTLGDGDEAVLPVRGRRELGLHKIDAAEFYESLLRLEYQYTGPFRALLSLERKLGTATGYITNEQSRMLIHPAVLDAAFQSLLLAHCAPNSGGIWSLHVPKTIRAVRVNPLLCEAHKTKESPIAFDCIQPAGVQFLEGDIDLFSGSNGLQNAMIQIESLQCVPFSRPTAQDDKAMFAKTVWDVATPDAEQVAYDGEPTTEQLQLARLLERMAVFYLRRLDMDIPKAHPTRFEGPLMHYFSFASHIISRAKEGKLPLWSSQWDHDSADDLAAAYGPYSHIADVKLLKAIGDNIVDIATGQTQPIEVGMQDAMLSQYYEKALGFKEHTSFLARLVKQIVHRYPHMNVLEVGAGTGGATKGIFCEVGNRFSSYTYTDISPGFFETARQVFGTQLHKMIFKVLDISKDIRQQGYKEHSYDLIVASVVLHATPSLQDTLKNVRRLLKPGGFLVVLELQLDNIARMGTIFGALPGWWLGAGEGRTLSPCVSLTEWDGLLRATGFSGCDTVTPVRNDLVMPLSVFLSQAVDYRVNFLRDPLSVPMSLFKEDNIMATQNLILLGGNSFQASRLMDQLKSILRHQWGHNISTARSLAETSSLDITSGTTVLSLLEIDGPVFKDLNNNNWEALKLLLQEASTILWVSSGCRAENPYANMMVGLLRSARQEIPTLDMQCFDTEAEQLLNARELAESLLRLKSATMWQRRDGHDSLLMTIEPVLVREQSTTLVIPRVVASQEMDDRFNSARRSIFAPASAHGRNSNFGIMESDDRDICLQQVLEPEEENGAVVRVTHSLRSAIRIFGSGFMHLMLGRDCKSDEQIVALSSEHTVLVAPLSGLSMPTSVPAGDEATFVALLAYHLLASHFLEGLPEGVSAIIHEPYGPFATILADEANRNGIRVVFTTTSMTAPELGWHTIHPMAPERVIRALLPANTAALFDLTRGKSTESIGPRIRALLPSHCHFHSFHSAFAASTTWKPQAAQATTIHARLKECVSRSSAGLAKCSLKFPTPTLSLYRATTHLEREIPHDTVFKWSLPTSGVSFRVQPADSQVQFSNCKTYWLAGLSGGLGLLLCEWMVRHGAKYIVISSRNPNIEEYWLETMRGAGAVVKVFSCDITDKYAVSNLYTHIQSTLPAIAGVCQGAMVLEDTAIRDMSLEALLKVTRPKVEGSLHLDQLFQAKDSDLDFFIFFSSAGSITGQPGQGNYAAANLFMTALAERRRRRGQVASVMHIGPIFGVGYITQQGLDTGVKSLANFKTKAQTWFPISEQDFCQQFAEAVIAGRSRSNSSTLEVTTSLAKFASIHEAGPLLSHYIQDQINTATDLSSDRSKVPLKSQLADARGSAQITRIIREAFLSKLSALFQIELSKLEQADPSALRLDEMGIDSLMAVEIRSWFVKTLQVNIPVLKILSGALVAELIDIAVKTIPRPLVPKIDEEGADMQATERVQPLQGEVESVLQQTHQAGHWASTSSVLTQHQQPEESLQQREPSSFPAEDNESPGTSPEETATTSPKYQETMELVAQEEPNPSMSEEDESPDSQSYINTPSDDATAHNSGWLKSPNTPLTTFNYQDDEKKQACRPHMPGIERILQLSFSQSLFWFSAAFSDNPTHLNLTTTFRMTGELRIEDLKSAVLALGQQHESLRTCFIVKDDQPLQGIMTSTALNLEHYTIQCESEVANYVNEIHSHVYDPRRGKTIRLALVSLSSKQHFFILGVHHLAMDGASFRPLMQDMLQHYTHGYQGMTARQYTEFSEMQHAEFSSGGFKEELEFWKNELAEVPPTLPMLRTSSLTSRPALQAYENKYVDVRVGPATKALIHALCRRCRTTPFHFYLAIFRVLLWRYTRSGNFAIGIGDANRTEEDIMGSIGNFVNLLPLVFCTEASHHFDAMLQETRSKTHTALANSRVPFQLLLNELGVARSAVTTPIFQAFVDYRLSRGEKMSWGDCQLELLSLQPSRMAYDVAVDIIDNADGDCRLTFIVRDDLYSQADAEQLAKSYIVLANAFAAQPSATLDEVDLFDRAEIEESLNLGRGPLYQARQWGSTVIHRIDDIAKRHPKSIAVIYGDGSVASYGDIVIDRVDAIVAQLQAVGITTGSTVAVLQEPTPDWVSSILAIMRLGATYLPLDVGTPWARLAAIVKDCQPFAVLVDEHTTRHVHRLEANGLKAVSVSNKAMGHRTSISTTSDAISTILYTSGSSGTPKGIVLTHRGIRSWLEPCEMLYNMKPSGEVILQQSSQGFDMSLMQIFTALCFGGSVYLLPRKFRGDARAISDAITRYGITHTYGTPSEYFSWLRYGDSEALRNSSWKAALVGGEPLVPSVLKEFAALGKDDLHFYHMYGTTESTFCAAVMELVYVKETSEETSGNSQPNYPAGITLPNYNVYILDEQRRPLPPGLQGEIYIGGAGVAREYLNNPSLTTKTFVPDIFATADDHARGWYLMQRTGDLGRWSRTEHGAILIEGRISGDTMVKLRGLRVDLREVEIAILRASAGVLSEAIVSVRRSSPDSPEFLVAHVVFEKAFAQRKEVHNQQLQQLRTELELPLYMQPAFIIALDTLPVMASGKLDRKAVSMLSLSEDHAVVHDIVLTPTEERLKAVWDDVLSGDLSNAHGITPETDFFHIGGTSLSLLSLRDKIMKQFGAQLTLVDLFEASVLSSMAHRIEGQIDTLEVIDWDEETKLRPCMIEGDNNMLRTISHSQSRVVILTGGTGYLGKGLIHDMIKDPTVKEVHCLGVRNVASRTDLKDLDKVTLYEGDLHQPRIGLSQSLINDLFGRADLIIHNGADISYMKTYQSLRQSNFLTTKDLVEWSMPRMIPFHYISTAGIGNFTPGSPLGETSVASSPPPTDGSMGYTACKWASESFLEKVVQRYPRWPICVHRPTLISRDDIPQLDGAHNILGYARKLGAVPVSEGVARGVVNVVQLEAVVTGVLSCALRQNRPDQHHRHGEVHFVNHAGKLNLPLNNMRKWALERTADGYIDFADVDLDEIPLEEWICRANELGMHPTMAALLTTFARDGEVEFPTIAKVQEAERDDDQVESIPAS